MTGRGIVSVAAWIITSVIAQHAGAAVVLRSAELSGETGSASMTAGQPPFVSVTPYGPDPFPNDGENFAGVGPDGLRVLVNQVALASGNTRLGSATRQWTNRAFTVVFETDEPAPFRYFRAIGGTDDSMADTTLQAEGQPPIPLRFINETTGVLPPGRYTFAGATEFGTSMGPTNGPFTYRATFNDVTLTVAPEPAALPLLAASCLCLRRRRVARRLVR